MVPKIDVRSSVARKCFEGELDFGFEAEEGLLDLPFVRFASPVSAKLSYEIFRDESVEVSGTIAFTLEGQCSRCLEDARREIRADVSALFTAGVPKGEEYHYRGVVDLTEFLRDSVTFALPPRLLCAACEEEE